MCLVALAALPASAQDAGGFDALEPLSATAKRAEGLVSRASDAGPQAHTLGELQGQPLVVYRLRCPDCPELERTAFTVPTALADLGLPVVLLLGGKNSTKRAAEKLLAKSPPNLRIAYGKKLGEVPGYQDVRVYGADGQARAGLNIYSDADAWALQAAAEKVMSEAAGAVPTSRRRGPRVGQPFPAALVDGLLASAPDAGTSSLDGLLGQPHVIFFACPGCGGETDLEALLPVVAPSRAPVVALVSHLESTRAMAEQLQKRVGPRAGLRIGWGAQLTPEAVRYSASTALIVDKRGIVRLATDATASQLGKNAWLIRAALERAQRER